MTNIDVELLTFTECDALLSAGTIGRVGVTTGGLPVILPVHYTYRDGVITFRTGYGTKAQAAANGDVLAFEVDHYDAATGAGWSVMVLGRASVVTTEHERDGLPTFDLPHLRGERSCYVQLACEVVSGRHLRSWTR